jgi:hypothetical protein
MKNHEKKFFTFSEVLRISMKNHEKHAPHPVISTRSIWSSSQIFIRTYSNWIQEIRQIRKTEEKKYGSSHRHPPTELSLLAGSCLDLRSEEEFDVRVSEGAEERHGRGPSPLAPARRRATRRCLPRWSKERGGGNLILGWVRNLGSPTFCGFYPQLA